MLKFFIQNIQGVLFIENFAFRDKLGIASKINQAVDNLFDGDPIMLDLPPEAPFEIPRIQLKDSKMFYGLNFSPTRIDFFYNEPGKPEKKLDSLSDNYLEYFFRIIDLVKGGYHLSIPRIAIIIKALSEVEKESTIFIYEKFLGNNSFFKNADKLEIHSLEKTKVKEYNINRWFRIRTGLGAGIKDNILAVEVDINTLPEKPVDFEIEKIRNFYITFFAFAKESFLNCFGVSL